MAAVAQRTSNSFHLYDLGPRHSGAAFFIANSELVRGELDRTGVPGRPTDRLTSGHGSVANRRVETPPDRPNPEALYVDRTAHTLPVLMVSCKLVENKGENRNPPTTENR